MPWLVKFLISMAISYVLQLFAPKAEPPKASEIGDYDIAKAEEGDEIIKIFGTKVIKTPQVHGYGDFKTVAIKDNSGKK